MTDPHRDRIAGAFDRELSRSPLPPDLRAQAVHEAVNSRDSQERQRPSRMLARVAALLAVAIVVTLVLTARSLHWRPVVPANPIPLPKSGALAPGTYFLANPNVDANRNCVRACSAYHRIIFTMPVGWSAKDGLVSKHLGQPGEVAFSAWSVRDAYADPCHWQQSALSPLDLVNASYDAVTGLLVPAPEVGGWPTRLFGAPVPARWSQ